MKTTSPEARFFTTPVGSSEVVRGCTFLLVRAASLPVRGDRRAVVSPTPSASPTDLGVADGLRRQDVPGFAYCRWSPSNLAGPLPQQVAVGRTDAADDSRDPSVALAAASSRRVSGLHHRRHAFRQASPQDAGRSKDLDPRRATVRTWASGRRRRGSIPRSGAAVAIRAVAAGRLLPKSDRALPQDDRHRGRPDRPVRATGGPEGAGSVRRLLPVPSRDECLRTSWFHLVFRGGQKPQPADRRADAGHW